MKGDPYQKQKENAISKLERKLNIISKIVGIAYVIFKIWELQMV